MRPANKYRAVRTEVDGKAFSSLREANRYRALRCMQERGEISGLELQPVFVLAPGVLVPGEKRRRPPLRYVADFRYRDSAGVCVVEDVKSDATRALPVYRMKKHLLALLGVYVTEVK